MKSLQSAIAVFAIVVFAVSCGGTPSSPSPSSAPAPGPETQGVTFSFETSVTATDRDLIQRGAAVAKSLFQSRFGRSITGTVTVDVKGETGPGAAEAKGHLVTIYAGNPSWARVASIGRTKIVVHEFFHIFQGELGWLNRPTEWLFEGAAEYVGYTGVIESGLITYAAVRACEVEIYFAGGGTATPPLHEISFLLASSVNSRYAVAWLGVDHLVDGLAGLPRLRGLWENSGTTEQQFQTAFRTTPVAFSNEFQNYRLSFQRGGGGACSSF